MLNYRSSSPSEPSFSGHKNHFSLQGALLVAKRIAKKHEVNILGTEHLLQAMLLTSKEILRWLEQKYKSEESLRALNVCLKELIDLKHLFKNEKVISGKDYNLIMNCQDMSLLYLQNMTSPCLARAIRIVESIRAHDAATPL